ncbi:TIGR03086 family metal-binding protein [Dermatobacter hominis]|uniref:TIGR03086 family metal-binding protein n=1 Tax=Dermatobacter hominis TaxID=2884263 RepID=UPI001D10FCEE|nr:TIGR03086 family metal-binding protein [Dermatobacter hominis]UDY35081.1 TIGR03086 family protein [Dermatobacter hominis]
MIDLRPAVDRMVDVVSSVADDQLALPTPCPDSSVGDLVDHVGTFAVRFREAAEKDVGDRSTPPPPPDGARLEPGWRARVADDLRALADAWQDPAAWEGTTWAGGIEMPAEVTALVALDELVVHGWDLAVATGHPYRPSEDDVRGATAFVSSFEAPRDGKLFGPVVDVGDGADGFDRLLGLTGRDPAWRPA